MIGILTEKPSAMRNFEKALGGKNGTYNGEDYLLVCARGHLFEFAEPEDQVRPELKDRYKSWDLKYLPWDEKDFSWKREEKKDADDTLEAIRSGLSGCDEITIATDDDPTGEGELLAWEILDALDLHPKKWSRMYFADEAAPSIQKAFKTRKTLQSMATDMDYVKADYRAKFDFLTIQFTRIASKNGDGHSVLRQGRLKSAMVLIVGDQLKKVSEYKRVPWYQNRFRDENGVVYSDPEEKQYDKKEDVPAQYHASAVVKDNAEMKHTAPPKMLDLASLSARLAPQGYKAKQVLDTYQKMYEAQVVSYPRTEDKVITFEQFNELLPKADAIADVVGVDKSLLTHRTPRSTHVKDGGAHGANRPGPNVPLSLDALSKYDSAGSQGLAAAIYETLAKNYLATLAEDYEYESQTGHLKDYPSFVGRASVPKKQGWKQVFGTDDDSDEDENAAGLGTMAEPFVYEGAPQKPAQPTMKWLMSQLEKRDVGTGATRTSIYADVTNAKSKNPLLIETKGKLRMAPAGEMSYRLLPGTHIGDLSLTEQLQSNMRDIAEGKADPDTLLAQVAGMVEDDKRVMMENGAQMREEMGVHVASPDDYASGEWNGEQVKFKRSWGGHDFTDSEIADLFAGKEISLMGMTSKSGSTYNVKGHLEKSSYKGHSYVGFASTGYLNDDGTPRESSANDADYASGTWKGKQVRFKKTWAGHEFTDSEIDDLLAGKTITIEAVSKAGKPFTASGKLANQQMNGRKYVGFKMDQDGNRGGTSARGGKSTGSGGSSRGGKSSGGGKRGVPMQWSGHKFTEDERIMLESGKNVRVDDFVSKAGKTFGCLCSYDADSGHIEFHFDK